MPQIDVNQLNQAKANVTLTQTLLNQAIEKANSDPTLAQEAMKQASNESYGYTEDEIVSSDIVGITYGSLFDATQTKVMTVGDKQLVKTVAWYDNEMSYTAKLVRTLEYFAKL